MYANEVKAKEKEKLPEIKKKQQQQSTTASI